MAASVALVFFARPTPAKFWVGLPLVVLGELIRVWSAGYLTKLSGLVTAGPFAMCRNPLYMGSFLMSLGYMTMCNRPSVLIVGVILFWTLHGAAVAYEERLLRDKFGDDFKNYCKRVPRFLPRLSKSDGEGGFSFEQMMSNEEYRGAATAALLLTVFGLMAFNLIPIVSWLH